MQTLALGSLNLQTWTQLRVTAIPDPKKLPMEKGKYEKHTIMQGERRELYKIKLVLKKRTKFPLC